MYQAIAPGSIGHPISLKEAAAPVAASGFTGIWLGIPQDENQAEETKELLGRYNLRPAGFGLPVDYLKDEATYNEGIEKFKKQIKFARDIGLERCMTWMLPASDTLAYRDNFEMHRSRLELPARILAEHGMRLGIEFLGPPKLRRGVKYPFIHNLDQAMGLCYAIGTGNVGLILDLWHWDLADQEYGDFLKLPDQSWIVAVHVMDAPAGIPAEEQEDLARSLPGSTGVLKAAQFFQGLIDLKYDGPVIPEPFVPALAEMSFEQALRTVRAAMDKIWPLQR